MNSSTTFKFARKTTLNSNATCGHSCMLSKPLIPEDPRCEFDLPKFCDLNCLDDDSRFSTLLTR